MAGTRTSNILRGAAAVLELATVLAPSSTWAQDVEMLAEHYGTRLPAAYYDEIRRNPQAYRPLRGWRPTLHLDNATFGRRGNPLKDIKIQAGPQGPVTGTFKFPLLLGLYSDTPVVPTATVGSRTGVPLTREVVQDEFFDGPNSRFATIPEFYSELSGGRVTLVGEVSNWVQTTLTEAEVVGASNGLSPTDQVGEFIMELLTAVDDGDTDWGWYDNDGLDGIPNSGDDDGYVDLLGVTHPTAGAECSSGGGNHIWSHYWTLFESAGQAFSTSTPAANGGNILVDDYTVQPVLDCDSSEINEIGVLAHEIGHAFGLPDLYGTGADHGGVGRWGLMGSGAWGCDGTTPALPCHMTAWSKEVLGWADVTILSRGVEFGVLSLDPVETSGDIFRIDAGDGSGDYYLLENRQALGFDAGIFSAGLLVWQIDSELLENTWESAAINSNPNRMGVWLRQADGSNDLARKHERGDAGDPYPGSSGQTEFSAGTVPSAFTHNGLNGLAGIPRNTAAGVTLLDIQQVSDQMQFRVLTRYQNLSLQSDGLGGTGSVFSVDGVSSATPVLNVSSAPFQAHLLEASGGELYGAGLRYGFMAWSDGLSRVREWQTGLQDVVLTASYGAPEASFDVTLASPVVGIIPGQVDLNPDAEVGWIRASTDVSVLVNPRTGFSFREWTGTLAGLANPVVVNLSKPDSATAWFDLSYRLSPDFPTTIEANAAKFVEMTFMVENGNNPVRWDVGTLPEGLDFHEENQPVVSGFPLDLGDFRINVQATDAIGLRDSVEIDLTVNPPLASLQSMAEPFLAVGTVDPALESFLDYQGNQSGGYDLGDFRSWVLAHPDHSMATFIAARSPIFIRFFRKSEIPR